MIAESVMEPYTITLSCMCMSTSPPEFNSAWLILGLWMIDMIDTIDWHQKDGINIKTDLLVDFVFCEIITFTDIEVEWFYCFKYIIYRVCG